MTLMATRFTPEVLLSAPRRSAAVPNASGTRALYSVSTYSFEEHKKTIQHRVVDLKTGQTELLTDDSNVSEPVWLTDDEVLLLKSGDNGTTTLVVQSAENPNAEGYDITTISAPISNVKVRPLPNGSLAFVCVALTTPSGCLFNPETAEKPRSTAKVYTSLFVRHWDVWLSEHRNSLFYSTLEKRDDGSGPKWRLSYLVNALKGTGLSCPVPPFGGTGDFDVGTEGICFVAKDPGLDPAMYTKTDLYFVPLKTFTEIEPPKPVIVKTPGLEGYSQSPVFSRDGKKIAFTRMKSRQYESDKTRLMLVRDVHDLETPAEEFFTTEDGEGKWDLRPDAILWSKDDSTLYVTAECRARTLIFKVPADPTKATDLPEPISTPEGSVDNIQLLGVSSSGEDALLVTTTSLTDNSCYSTIHPTTGTITTLSSATKHGKTLGLSRSQVDSITFPGSDGSYDVHALVVRPSFFDPKKKYPLCMLIHGGPQGAWSDAWSTRWNPAVFAEQGYVVVAPNPTGSTGYGMEFENAITGQWGGRPYEDLVKCFEWIEQNMPEVDTSRAVAAGASYGGFMINWIQGHPLGRKFKALVCHDGVFSTLNQWCTEELFFPIHDFEGTLEENREGYERWDPARFISEWATPELIIHSELDYRLPVTEGLAAFNVLQAKKVPSKLLVFPDENHWVLKPENSLVWHREVLGWLNRWSGIADEQESNETSVVIR